MLETPAADGWQSRLIALYRAHRSTFGWLFALQLVVYSYFFTTVVFTNHTFPNSQLFPYPSYKTKGEGRWLADIIIFLQGGSGVQSTQMFLGVAIHTINAIAFCLFLGVQRKFDRVLFAAFLCLYPAFLDNYSFTMDHVTFALADSFAIAGIFAWTRISRRPIGFIVAALLFLLSLAAYQPKISLIALLCLCHLLMRFTRPGMVVKLKSALLETVTTGLVFAAGAGLYLLSTKLTVVRKIGDRTQVSTPSEMWAQAVNAFAMVHKYFWDWLDFMPVSLSALPWIVIAVGAAVLVVRGFQKSILSAIATVVLLALVPIALRLCYIINREAWESAGRIVFVYGYALLFFHIAISQFGWLRRPALASAALFTFMFAVIASQETNAAALKTIYDVQFMTRITARIEAAAPDIGSEKYGLVVLGAYPELPRERYMQFRKIGNRPNVALVTFENFRHVPMINFFLGHDALIKATREQVTAALESAPRHKPWPAADSVYMVDGAVVVLLEPYRKGMKTTGGTWD